VVNIVRTAIEALAAVLGGTQSLHTNSYDEALALPAEEAERIALRTQQVIAHETGVTSTVDPLGGSYFVEALTNELERSAYEYFARIDELGGMVAAIEANFPQREISDAAFAHQAALENEKRIMVGVNAFRVDDDELTEIHRPDPAAERRQRERLSSTVARRDGAAADASLAALERAAAEDRNLMPALLDCARARVSEGEMVAALQRVFGTYTETPVY
jgi:methylmalonyl-CoA mutase N-terminal domain/subunit